jgi:hypothetical protein
MLSAIGLALLGTVTWTVVSNSLRSHAATAAGAASSAAVQLHALSVGFDRAFLVAAAISLLMLVVAVAMIRVSGSDLAGH